MPTKGDWAPSIHPCSLPCQSQPLKCKSTHKSQPFTARFLEIGSCICTFSTHHLLSTSAWSLYFPFLWKLLSLHLKFILSAFPPFSSSNIQCYAKNSPTTLAKQKPDTKKKCKTQSVTKTGPPIFLRHICIGWDSNRWMNSNLYWVRPSI